MGTVSVTQLIADTRQFMDAVGSSRWSDALIKTVLNNVYDQEWSNLLNAAPYYTFATRTVTPDSNGIVDLSDLNAGTGDNQQNVYRVLGMNDGNYQFRETRFQDVPLATSTNYLSTYPRLFYRTGDAVQVLPRNQSASLNVVVNWKPTPISDLASGASTITYPDNNHLILCYQAAAELLQKGGAEAEAAAVLRSSAASTRASLLNDIRRLTITPTFMSYPDLAWEWAAN